MTSGHGAALQPLGRAPASTSVGALRQTDEAALDPGGTAEQCATVLTDGGRSRACDRKHRRCERTCRVLVWPAGDRGRRISGAVDDEPCRPHLSGTASDTQRDSVGYCSRMAPRWSCRTSLRRCRGRTKNRAVDRRTGFGTQLDERRPGRPPIQRCAAPRHPAMDGSVTARGGADRRTARAVRLLPNVADHPPAAADPASESTPQRARRWCETTSGSPGSSVPRHHPTVAEEPFICPTIPRGPMQPWHGRRRRYWPFGGGAASGPTVPRSHGPTVLL